ncbi:hypothetical protein [Flavihumibacter solisilvae]|uniref:Beta-lactamase-inhibitor-like PepSY-like domain-containing protein n=1 Tax=Flavihumibacter solisilvae TaxID=1349421 RepID=A0A0C1L7V3_9BACT|nr:hypothetical protein [Flavihumibacter solisilvae]KIC95676.1 hypothetical protein OI18_05400 [Flavihumibacter solisilvae]
MKKKLMLAITVVLNMTLSAQTPDEVVITGTNKVSKQELPAAVIAKLEKQFPNAQAVQYYKVPQDVVAKGWNVTVDDELDPAETVDYYTIQFTRDNMNYYGLYKPDGTLIKSKLEQQAATLPDPVKASISNISQTHPGWTVVAKTYYKNTSATKNLEYYEVVARNDAGEHRRLYFAPDGTLKKLKKE